MFHKTTFECHVSADRESTFKLVAVAYSLYPGNNHRFVDVYCLVWTGNDIKAKTFGNTDSVTMTVPAEDIGAAEDEVRGVVGRLFVERKAVSSSTPVFAIRRT